MKDDQLHLRSLIHTVIRIEEKIAYLILMADLFLTRIGR